MTGVEYLNSIKNYNKMYSSNHHSIEEMIAYITTKSKRVNDILDINCNEGILTRALSKRYKKAKIMGIDSSEDSISLASNLFVPENVNYKIMPSYKACELDKKFDLIFFNDIEENDELFFLFIQKSIELLRKDGLLVVILNKKDKRLPLCLDRYEISFLRYCLNVKAPLNIESFNVFNPNKQFSLYCYKNNKLVTYKEEYIIVKIKKIDNK